MGTIRSFWPWTRPLSSTAMPNSCARSASSGATRRPGRARSCARPGSCGISRSRTSMTYAKVLRYWLLTYAAVAAAGVRPRSWSATRVSARGCTHWRCWLRPRIRRRSAPLCGGFDAGPRHPGHRRPANGLGRLRSRQYNHRWIDKLLLSDRRYLDRSGQIVQAMLVALRAMDQPLLVYATSPSINVDTQELAAVVRRRLRGTT